MKYLSIYLLFYLSYFSTIELSHGQGKLKYLNHAATGKNDGTSWQDAYTQIDSAFNNAVKGDTIWIAKGEYSFSNAKRVSLSGLDLSIIGGFDGTETSINHRKISENPTIIQNYSDGIIEVFLFNVFYLQDGNYTIDGLIIQNGGALGLYPQLEDPDCYSLGPEGFMCKGGGIYVYSQDTTRPCNLTLKNCTIRNNDAIEGGGVYVNSYPNGKCGIQIDSCVFVDNYAKSIVGALSISMGAANQLPCRITNTEFISNHAYYAVGGLDFWSILDSTATLHIENCSFVNNGSQVNGAASIRTSSKNPSLMKKCQFISNVATAFSGGGLAALEMFQGKVENCVFLSNKTYSEIIQVRTVDFTNCIFAKNRASKSQSNLITTFEWGLPKPNEESNFYNCSFYDDSNGAKNMFSSISQNTNFYNCAFSAKDSNLVFFESVSDTLSFTNCSFSRGGYDDKFFENVLDIDNVFQTDCLWNTLPDYRDTMNNDFRLTSCSPLLNKGSDLVLPLIDSTDLAGAPRVLDSLIDIGAYESPLIKYSYNTNSDNICASDTLGSIVFNVEGGIAPYSLMYKDQNYKTLHVENIQSGTQTIILTDSSNCKLAIEENFGPEKISFDTVLIDASSKLSSDGSIVLKNIKGGNPPISLQWSNGISGDSLGSLAFGFYQVTITDQNGCSETFNFFVNAPNQTQEQAINRLFKLMPNPVKNILTIEIITQNQATSLKSIRCFDVLGKEVFKSPINSYTGQLTVNTEKLSNGLYIIELSDENGIRYVQKFVKE